MHVHPEFLTEATLQRIQRIPQHPELQPILQASLSHTRLLVLYKSKNDGSFRKEEDFLF